VPHAAKTALRTVSTTLTGGLANPVISLLEDAIAVVTFILAILVPVLVVILLVLTLFFAQRLYRRRRQAEVPA
jgi:uncharacterized paraquat-inducible protein A